MSQMEEFLKQVEAVQAKDEKVLVVTGKPAAAKANCSGKRRKPKAGIMWIPGF